MSRSDLGGPVLASVSRSFFLTLRLLPDKLRAPIGLAYLLARTSDTIADSHETPVALRLEHLASFGRMLRNAEGDNLGALQREIVPGNAAEKNLLSKIPECLTWLTALPESDRHEIQCVLAKIIKGQTLDLERFADPTKLSSLESADDLDEYTYLVAGCVGEFWTRISLHNLRRYGQRSPEALCAAGIEFGKGLQLINILRDLPADLRAGRCYLPADELMTAGITAETLTTQPQRARPVVDRWMEKAEIALQAGHRYIEALYSPRLRAACFLPWHIGIQTLELMRAQPPLETAARLKIPRSAIRRSLLMALPVAFSNRALDRIAQRGGPTLKKLTD